MKMHAGLHIKINLVSFLYLQLDRVNFKLLLFLINGNPNYLHRCFDGNLRRQKSDECDSKVRLVHLISYKTMCYVDREEHV